MERRGKHGKGEGGGEMCSVLGRKKNTLDMSVTIVVIVRLIQRVPQKHQKEDTLTVKTDSWLMESCRAGQVMLPPVKWGPEPKR